MSEQTILVQAGRGKTGKRVARRLRERGITVRAASRSGETRFDWMDESTWGPALAGVDAVYLVPLEATGDRHEEVARFVRQAVAAGVRKLVMLSARDVDTFEVEDTLNAERAVRESGVAWTILRPGWFHQNFDEDYFEPSVRAGEVLLATGDGLEPFIDAEDIAEVAVAAFTQDGHDGQIYDLSGAEPLTFPQALEIIAAELGREIRVVDVEPAQYIEKQVGLGMPREFAELIARLYERIRAGKEAHLSDGVQRVLGREPRSFAAYVKNAVAAGSWR
ncbi:NAD(P)H-binding protein [Crossiella sp. CA-258035]|uniref:NAD(P)H-binding protein n=1 Tax=Crossiella sp. CA-258035 TaxID=2981138 RepID=UPI0024BC3C5C|nr:NAD(P)H-binding protein [Crossiella sp. CA-258035]WHT21519.1 NAD(P)H-binding protein [Crossiella sp. CA-258035]